jgi:O-antigen ligase
MKFIQLAFVFLLSMMGFLAIWQFVTGTAITDDGRISTFFTSANYLAMLMMPVLLFVLAKFLVEKKAWWWEITAWIMGLAALILSASYVGLISFVLGSLFLTWVIYTKSIKSFLMVVLAGVVLSAVFVNFQSDQSRLHKMIDLSERSSVTVRLEVWQTAMYMIKNTGLVGIGLGNFEEKYLEYAPQIFHPPMEWKMLHAHNLYLHTWLSVTFFGMLLLIGMVLVWWTMAVRLLRKREYYWLYASLAILLAWAVGGLFDTPYYKNDLSFLFWSVLAMVTASANIQNTEIKNLTKN